MPSIVDYWSTREALDMIGTMKEAMPIGTFQDMYTCQLFIDDMDEVDCKEWEDIEANAKHDSMRCAHHR
jgi:hypothetical protein